MLLGLFRLDLCSIFFFLVYLEIILIILGTTGFDLIRGFFLLFMGQSGKVDSFNFWLYWVNLKIFLEEGGQK